ncbi:MAG: PAS domain-containing protein [Alphaproteobacteria bacterium]|nr:PAS domain-containing protein [Alphaproteobacteria bacterium]
MNALIGRLTLGIQARLVILVLVTVLPLVGLVSVAMIRAVDSERARIERDVRDRVENLLADVDRQITGVQGELQVLAVSPSLQTDDFAAFDRHMREALKIQGTSIALHDTRAHQLLSTTRPFGEPLPYETNSEMLDRVVETGKAQISDLIIGAVLRRPILTVGVPVFRDGKVAYVLAMGLGPEILSALLNEQNLASGWNAGIFDRNGLIVAHNHDLGRFIGQPAMPPLRTQILKSGEGWFPSITKGGLPVYSAFRRSPISGWTVVIGVPREYVDAPLRRAQWLAFGGGGMAVALSLALAWWMARAIRRPVESLTISARALGSGASAGPPVGGVRELDQIGEALCATAAALEQRARAREQAEAALRASEERFRMLAESLPQLVWTCLPDGRVDYLSRQWLDYTGMSEAEPLDSQRLKQVIHPDDLPATTASWAAAAEGRAPYDLEHRIRAADGTYRWFKTRGTPVTDATGQTIKWFGTCTDIQDIVEARDTLAHSREQLEVMVEERTRELAAANARLRTEIGARELAQAALMQAQKMEAVGQLTGGIAHDFNNLLTAVSGSLELLEARTSDEKSLRLLHTAQRGASRGAKLTQSLLAFARKQHLEPVPADLNSVIAEMSEMLRSSVGPPVDTRQSLASELWPVMIDVNQIESALLNIAINARDAMPQGGTLLIETANVLAGNAELPDEMAGRDCVLVSMRDTGTGMSPEVIEHAFEPFFTTKEIGRGTGLGLSMVFGVVRQSGGAVRIHSRIREGTTVQIYLPRAIETAAFRLGRATQAQLAGGAHILVVDDDPDVGWVTAECLREIGHQVTEARSGGAALTILEQGGPCDLLVMDLAMPGLSGVETVRLARRARPELRALFCTGYADDSTFEDETGGDVLLKKPFGSDALIGAVQRALRRKADRGSGNVVPLRRGEQPQSRR